MSNKNIRGLSYRKGLEHNLFEKIAVASQKESAEKDMKEVAKEFMIDESVVLGTSSFYDFTRAKNQKHKIHICNGTACMVANTQSKTRDWVSEKFEESEIGHAACVGRCHSNGAILYKDQTFSVDSKQNLNQILSQSGEEDSENKYFVGSNTTPVLTAKIEDLSNFFALHEKLDKNMDQVVLELKESKLRGRGGAGFPFWFKLDAVKKERAEQKYVVCNADEGDPGAYSDMYLMEQQPFKVLFGMFISGLCCGADTGVLYIRGEYPHSVRIINKAIEKLNRLNLIDGFKFKIIKGQGSYICGEETALLNSIEGLRPEVRVRPPYPAQYGLYGKPTLLSNVETFANLHWILENGGKAYADLGTEQSTGTKLVSLDSFFKRPGIYEIEMGTSLSEIFNNYGEGLQSEIKAFQIGGPLGGIVPSGEISKLTLDFESFDKAGFLLGHGSVVSIPNSFPMVRFLEHLMEFTALESCGKCYPCRIGSQRGYEMLKKAQEESYKVDRKLFDDLIETLEIGSLCALGGGVPLPVKNALKYFDKELDDFFKS